MKTQQSFFIRTGPVTCVLLLLSCVAALAQNDKYACSEPNPQSLCNAGNTCGSSSSPCIVDVKRSDNGASATPSIADAKANSTFCVKTGTKIVWKSTQKNTGFRRRLWVVCCLRFRRCDYGRRHASRLRDREEGRLLQVLRRRMYLRRDSGNVRLQHGGGHYYRGRVSLEMTHSAKVAIRLMELVKPC